MLSLRLGVMPGFLISTLLLAHQVDASEPSGRDLARGLRAMAQAQAHSVSLFIPFFSVDRSDEAATLILLNTAGYPLPGVEVRLKPCRSCEAIRLASLDLPAMQHLALPLAAAQAAVGPALLQGTLEVRFDGQPDGLQAWLVSRRGSGLSEHTLRGFDASQGNRFVSFWSVEAAPRVSLHLLNVSASSLDARFTVWADGRAPRSFRASLEPGALLSRVLPRQSGGPSSAWLELEHDGEPGALLGQVLAESATERRELPWLPRSNFDPGAELHEVLALPETRAEWSTTTLELLALEPGRVTAELVMVDRASGLPLAQATVPFVGRRALQLRMSDLLGDLPESEQPGRLRVEATVPVAVRATTRLQSGGVRELAVFAHRDAHAGGSYPLLPLTTGKVETALVNLGAVSVQVVAQVAWAGGSYSVGPFAIPSGASHVLDWHDQALFGPPDLLGRRLDPSFQAGFVRWISVDPGAALIARTEVQPLDTEDRFGFSCFGCCWQYATGEILPATVEMLVGQSKAFEACVTYSTCTGDMGPYPTAAQSRTVPSPFSWNGSTVSASGVAAADLLFQGTAPEVTVSCSERTRSIFGSGRASTCREKLRKSHDPQQLWSATQACGQQLGDRPAGQRCGSCFECCQKTRDYKVCGCTGSPAFCELRHDGDYQTCVGICISDFNC